jgi:hypothetical protein
MIYGFVSKLLVGKEIEYIFDLTTFYLINLCVRTSGAGECSKVFVLNVKYFGPKTTRRPELVFLVFPVIAFWTMIL